jgi:hypothetical protein
MSSPTRRRRILLAILVAGLGAAVVIWLRANAPSANPLGYDPEDTKTYLRQMEVYGGTANLLATELRVWFASLWRGERLAYTVAILTLVAAGGYSFFTREPLRAPAEGSDAEGDPGRAARPMDNGEEEPRR